METTQTQYLALSDGVFSVWQRSPGAKRGWTDTGLGEKPSALLSVLLVSGQPVHRTLICRLLWPGSAERAARNCLRQALFRIRRKLGRESVQEVNGGLAVAMPGMRNERDPEVAAERSELRALVGSRPNLRLVEAGDVEPQDGTEWRARVDEFLTDPAGQLPEAGLRLAPPEPEPTPSQPRRGRRASGRDAGQGSAGVVAHGSSPRAMGRRAAAGRLQELPPVPVGSRLLVLDLGPEPVHSAREAACRVVKQLWVLRGAMGVEPGHRDTLIRCQDGGRVTMEALWSAIDDLLAAIVEEGPVLFRVASPERWPRAVLRRMSSALDRLRNSPLTYLGTGIQLPSSYDRTAPALDDLSPSDAGRNAPRTARG